MNTFQLWTTTNKAQGISKRIYYITFLIIFVPCFCLFASTIILVHLDESRRAFFGLFMVVFITLFVMYYATLIRVVQEREFRLFLYKQETDSLFTVSALDLVGYTRKAFTRIRLAEKLYEKLLSIMAEGNVPKEADRIMQVNSIKETGSAYKVVCVIQHSNGNSFTKKYTFYKGYPNMDALVQILNQKMTNVQ